MRKLYMTTVKTIWDVNHTEEQSSILNSYCERARNQGKLIKIEFDNGIPVMQFKDDAAADEYIALIQPWNPTSTIRA